jgi:hypothetical protein
LRYARDYRKRKVNIPQPKILSFVKLQESIYHSLNDNYAGCRLQELARLKLIDFDTLFSPPNSVGIEVRVEILRGGFHGEINPPLPPPHLGLYNAVSSAPVAFLVF